MTDVTGGVPHGDASSPPPPSPSTFTAAAKDLIQRLLVVEPSKRYSAAQVLAHPWVAATDDSGAHDISRALLEMKKFNAKRKFRAGIRVAKVISTLQASAKVCCPPPPSMRACAAGPWCCRS